MSVLSSAAILIVISFFVLVGCCVPKGRVKKVTIGNPTYVCVYVGPLNWNKTGHYIQVSTIPVADHLSEIVLPQGWTSVSYANDSLMTRLGILDSFTPGAGVGVTVGSLGVLSYQRIFREIFLDRSVKSTSFPTSVPSGTPSNQPSSSPSTSPSYSPTSHPTKSPFATKTPSFCPTQVPTHLPSISPSFLPTDFPSFTPTISPTLLPSISPTVYPSALPTEVPSTALPSRVPSNSPSHSPTVFPSFLPTEFPTLAPVLSSENPSFTPTEIPTNQGVTLSPTNARRLSDEVFNITSITFPILFAIIHVEKGTVKSIVWDNFCSWCGPNRCMGSTLDYNNELVNADGENCFVRDSQCYSLLESNTTVNGLCELRVFVSWYGTDSTGANFVSSSSRFSRWSSEQMLNYTSSLRGEDAYIALK